MVRDVAWAAEVRRNALVFLFVAGLQLADMTINRMYDGYQHAYTAHMDQRRYGGACTPCMLWGGRGSEGLLLLCEPGAPSMLAMPPKSLIVWRQARNMRLHFVLNSMKRSRRTGIQRQKDVNVEVRAAYCIYPTPLTHVPIPGFD